MVFKLHFQSTSSLAWFPGPHELVRAKLRDGVHREERRAVEGCRELHDLPPLEHHLRVRLRLLSATFLIKHHLMVRALYKTPSNGARII